MPVLRSKLLKAALATAKAEPLTTAVRRALAPAGANPLPPFGVAPRPNWEYERKRENE